MGCPHFYEWEDCPTCRPGDERDVKQTMAKAPPKPRQSFECGDRVWFVEADDQCDSVYEGRVEAAGPDKILVAVDGPWTNVVHGTRTVRVKMAQHGRAPSMAPRESFMDYGIRCRAIVDRDDDVEKLRKEAARLGLKVSE
jgi:hypothetical protein